MREIPERPSTLVEMLSNAAGLGGVGARFVDRREGATETSLPELWRRAQSSAGLFLEAGVHPGDRVVIMTPTDVGFYDAFFGALIAGAIPTPVYPPVRLGKLDEWVERTVGLLRRSGATTLVADRRSRRVLGQVMERVQLRCGLLKLEKLADHEPIHRTPSIDPDDVALVQFSSGTTREPAPIALTHRQILANVEVILDTMPEEAYDSGGCVSWLPLYHDMGLIGCVLTTLRAGYPMTLIPPEVFLARPAIWLRTLSRYRGAVSPAPNFAYARCAQKVEDDELDGVDLSSWVVAMNGAEPISVAAMRDFQRRFGPFGLRPEALTPVYGLAEAALAVTFSPLEEHFRARSFDRQALSRGEVVLDEDGLELPSLGRPLDGYDVQVRDGENAVGEDTVGDIWVRGPSLTEGYLDGDPPTADGWLDTGDRGFIHDGDLWICGRAKDVIVVRGRNHAAHDLERACDDVEGVRTGCVVAVSEVTSEGDRVFVFVEAREPREGLAHDCRRKVRSRTGVDPDVIVVVEPGTLPRTSSGKLRRQKTLQMYREERLDPPGDVGPTLLAKAFAKSALGYLRR